MADSNVNIRINAQNNASPQIKKVQTDLGGLDKAAGTAAGGIGALAKVAGAAGLVALGIQAAQAAVELAQLGNQSIAMRASFEQMAGGAENAATILQSLTEASRGTISQYDLMLTANRAMLLGVADSAEEMSQLMEIAAVRGRAMGLSTTQAFNDIVTGLGRESKLILDNLGILVDLEGAHASYAASIGKTAAELTDVERKQALVNQVIESSAGLLADANSNSKAFAGEGMVQLNTAWTDFRTALGESLGPLFDARAKEAAAGVQLIIDSINNRGVTQAKSALDDLLLEAQKRADLNNLPLQDPNANLRFDPYPDQPVPPAPVAPYDDQVQRIQLVKFALEEVGRAQADNVPGAELWAEQIQRVTDRVIQFGEVSDSSLGAVARLLANIQNARVDKSLQDAIDRGKALGALTDSINPALQEAAPAVDKFAQSFSDALSILEGAEGKLNGLYDTLLDTGNIEGAAAAYGQIRGVLQEIVAEWVRQGVAQDEITNNLLPKLVSELDNLIGKQVEAGDAGIASGELIGSGFLSAIPGIQAVIGIVNQLTGAVIAAGDSIRAVQRQANLAERVFGGRGVRTGGGDIGLSRADATARGIVANERTGLRRQGPVVGDLVPLSVGGGGGSSAIDSQLASITNKVKSVLTGALKSGINLDDILPRQDAVEEPARRLADIAVRGFDSPWVDYIKNTFPEIWSEIESAGDPKAAAASILRDFEDGLRPELLDKGRAKELVKRALLGEQNTAALANEIATELASEMGISLQQAQEAAAGVLGTGSTGTGDGTGMDGNVAAASFTDAFIGTMGAMLERFKGAGNSAGSQWGVGFMASVEAGVPAQLIGLLVALVTPGVMASMATGSSRTGAS